MPLHTTLSHHKYINTDKGINLIMSSKPIKGRHIITASRAWAYAIIHFKKKILTCHVPILIVYADVISTLNTFIFLPMIMPFLILKPGHGLATHTCAIFIYIILVCESGSVSLSSFQFNFHSIKFYHPSSFHQ